MMSEQTISRLSALRHCMSYPQDFGLFWGQNGVFRKKAEMPELSLEDAKFEVDQIVRFYADLIASGNNVLRYLYFDLAFGITAYRGGYLIDAGWAKGAYEAAKLNKGVFDQLSAVVATNLRLGIAMPKILVTFTAEVLDGSFPTVGRGRSADTNLLRDYAIFECVDLLCNRFGLQMEATGKQYKISAKDIIEEAFTRVSFGPSAKVGKPDLSAIKRGKKGEKQEAFQRDIALLKWTVRHQAYNAWFRNFWIKKSETRIKNFCCACFH